MTLRTALAAFAMVAAAAIAGCTEGSTTSPPINNTIILPTPTPAPVATPTPTPAPAAIGGSAISMTFTTAGSSAQFTVTENSYGGPLTAANGSPSCAGIATFAPASGTGPSATFTLTAVAAGTCSIVVSDNHGGSVGVNVTVTTTTGTVSSIKSQPH